MGDDMKRINRRLYYKGKRCMLFKQVCKNCGQLKIVYKKLVKGLEMELFQ